MYYHSSFYVLTSPVTVCACHAELKGYLLVTFLMHTRK